MKLGIVAFVALVTKSFSDCSYLGKPEPLFNDACECESGWIGKECNQLNFTTVPEAPSSYAAGVYTADFPTWGGSILALAGRYYWVGSTIYRGMRCWPNTSGLSIMRANKLTGPWELVSHVAIGNYTGYNRYLVPWSHNNVATLEYKLANASDPNSKKTYAFVVYGITKSYNNQNQILPVNMGPISTKICSTSGWAMRFPVSSQNQKMYAAYVELLSDKQADLDKEILAILESRTLRTNINGFNYTGYLNTGFKWHNLAAKIPKVPLNAVNPSPLTSHESNSGALMKRPSGEYYRVLAYRYTLKKESIGLLGLKADKFIWEPGQNYLRGPTISRPWNIEDPFLFESANGYHLILHDGRTCGKWDACGSIMHHAKGEGASDILASNSGWSMPTMLYNRYIDSLKYKIGYRQRPVLFFNNSAPRALLNGAIWENNPGKSRTYVALLH